MEEDALPNCIDPVFPPKNLVIIIKSADKLDNLIIIYYFETALHLLI